MIWFILLTFDDINDRNQEKIFMLNIRLIIVMVFQINMLSFASDEKKIILSKEDDELLGDNLELFLNSNNPQLEIASSMGIGMNHRDLFLNRNSFLPKHINHRRNWLMYFNKKKLLHPQDQMECCRALKKSAQYIRILSKGKPLLESFIFLKLLPYCFDVEQCKAVNNVTFAPFCHTVYKDNPSNSIMNSFIYFYKPSLSCWDESNQPCLKLLIKTCQTNLLFELSLQELLKPIMYELKDDKVIKKSYKKTQKTIITALCALKKIEKTHTIKVPRRLLHAQILSYLPEVEFLKYCHQVEQDIGNQIEWIKAHDRKWYQNKISHIPFLENSKNFKEWYTALKFSAHDYLIDNEDS